MTIKEATKLQKAVQHVTSCHTISQKEGVATADSGLEELNGGRVDERVILETTRIDTVAYQSSFHLEKCQGNVPVNISLFAKEDFIHALDAMKKAFKAGLCVSELVAVVDEGKQLGKVTIPHGKVGLTTLSQILIKGALLKAGIPVDSKFGGIIQIRKHEPLRFVNLIEYTSTSLDPSEIFIAAQMTSVNKVIEDGNGKILASFWEIPSSARPNTEAILQKLEMWGGVRGLLKLGKEGEQICETPMRLGRVGMIIIDGLNPVAAAYEAGAEVTNHTISELIDFSKLQGFWDSYVNWSEINHAEHIRNF